MCGDTFAPPLYAPDRIRTSDRAKDALMGIQKIFFRKIDGIPGTFGIAKSYTFGTLMAKQTLYPACIKYYTIITICYIFLKLVRFGRTPGIRQNHTTSFGEF
jgi:hypothetical protein